MIYHPSGGSPEIVEDAGMAGEPDLFAAVDEIRSRYQVFRDRVMARRSLFSIAAVADAYRQVFERLGSQPA